MEGDEVETDLYRHPSILQTNDGDWSSLSGLWADAASEIRGNAPPMEPPSLVAPSAGPFANASSGSPALSQFLQQLPPLLETDLISFGTPLDSVLLDQQHRQEQPSEAIFLALDLTHVGAVDDESNASRYHVPETTRIISASYDLKEVTLAWPDEKTGRRFHLSSPDCTLRAPVSLSPLIRYSVETEEDSESGRSFVRLVPVDPQYGRFTLDPSATVDRLCALAETFFSDRTEAGGRVSAAMRSFRSRGLVAFDENLLRQLSAVPVSEDLVAHYQHFLAVVFDWLHLRLAMLEHAAVCASPFVDDLRSRIVSDAGFRLALPLIAQDLRTGENILAHHLCGNLSLEDVRRWARKSAPELSARLGLERHGTLWQNARALFDAWMQVYVQMGPYIDGPRASDPPGWRDAFEFFAQQGIFRQIPASTDDGEKAPSSLWKHLMLDVMWWHEEQITEIFARLIELSDQSCMQPPPHVNPDTVIESFESLAFEHLVKKELVVIDHPFDSASETLVDPLARIALLQLWPGQVACGAPLPQAASGKVIGRNAVSLLVIRKVHFWTPADLAHVLCTAFCPRDQRDRLYAAQRKSNHVVCPRLVVEGDLRLDTRVCRVVKRASVYHLGRLNCPVRGIYAKPSISLMRAPSNTSPRRVDLISNTLAAVAARSRPAMVFRNFLVSSPDPQHAGAISLVPAGTLPPAKCLLFHSIAALMEIRAQLPIERPIYVRSSMLRTFEDLYFVVRATLSDVIIAAENASDIERVFA